MSLLGLKISHPPIMGYATSLFVTFEKSLLSLSWNYQQYRERFANCHLDQSFCLLRNSSFTNLDDHDGGFYNHEKADGDDDDDEHDDDVNDDIMKKIC